MKLKYYLRGIGIGVIVATLIMTVSSVIHNNNLSDEFIIKEAQKLGMIMPENTEDDDSLWGSDTEDDAQADSQTTEDSQASENTLTTESTQMTEDTQMLEDTQTSEDTQTLEDTQTTEETQNSEDAQVPPEETTAVIRIYDSDGAGSVARKLYSLGIVDSADDFHAYLKNNGYSKRIRSGSFEISKDATYDEICDIIIN